MGQGRQRARLTQLMSLCIQHIHSVIKLNKNINVNISLDTHCSPFPAGNTWRLQSACRAGKKQFPYKFCKTQTMHSKPVWIFNLIVGFVCYLCELGESTRVSHLPLKERSTINQQVEEGNTLFFALDSLQGRWSCQQWLSYVSLWSYVVCLHGCFVSFVICILVRWWVLCLTRCWHLQYVIQLYLFVSVGG